MTQKSTALTPEESAIANRDLKGQTAGSTVSTAPVTGTTPVGTTPVGTTPVGTTPVGTTPVTGANHPRTHASAEPGDPNIEEDATLPHAGSPFKDINRGNRSSMDE
ncbi:hypothetical protein [Pigmentiphaga litoralis]|uniref:Uncharacterized protein n=1 Tax=Pigmentiphaga litoralis TaxID=516702 RepID=A0A7Y9IYV6_9BURK|nr:hypothetical protein [Pigmentiphaga litoralis]NYE26928.1 hypothetical protein [Pigmentiphaga litoralis]NYE85662.1 hypothetical protein [Pigmentiphaga litoralis]